MSEGETSNDTGTAKHLPPDRILDDRLDHYRKLGVTQVKLGLADVDGVLRGKYVGLNKFASLLHKSGGFCDCVFGWDVDDQLYDQGIQTGWHTGFPDTGFRLLVESERWLAEENCPYFIAEFVAADGSDHPLCPRTLLRSILDRYAEHGLSPRSGFEYEFFVFNESPHTVREKGYRGLTSLTPGNFGYSVLRASAQSQHFIDFMDYCRGLGCELEGLHCETGPGVWEAALMATDGMEAADRAVLFKTFAKVFFQRRDMMATFMAKWSMDYPGQSGHLHVSLLDKEGRGVFFDDAGPAKMSTLQRHAVGGMRRYLREFLAFLAPTINSYTRLVQGAWAPTAATWGVENRTTAIRVIGGDAGSQRIECRVGGADANPYLVQAAVLAAALAGIEEAIEPGEPVQGNAYYIEANLPGELRFASHLGDAADALDASKTARRLFGDTFVEHFVMTRRWEAREYHRHLNSWQLERYFEII